MDVMRQSQLANILGGETGSSSNVSSTSVVANSIKSSSRSEDLQARIEEDVSLIFLTDIFRKLLVCCNYIIVNL